MAKVKLESIIDHLAPDFQRVLEITVRGVASDVEIDSRRLFIAFRENVRRHCSSWETVPDRYVDGG